MMINGFMPRMPLLSPSQTQQRSIASAINTPSPLLSGFGNTSLSASRFPTQAAPNWSMGSWLNPMMGNMMSGASQFGSQLFGGLGNAFSSFGSGIGQLNMPSLPSMNTFFAPQSPTIPPMFGMQPMVRQQPIFQSISQGAGQALKDLGNFAKNNAPAALAMGGAVLGGGAVCAFMGGAMAATSGIMLGNQAMQSSNHPV